MWDKCVIDASMGIAGGCFNFCPIEGDIDGDFQIVTGMNYLSTKPLRGMKLVAIVHPEGQQAVNRFCAEHIAALDAMKWD